MTLTPEQSSTITRHLAEKVLGWHKEEFGLADYWMIGADTVLSTVDQFSPLTDPRDCALVMKAWHEAGNGLNINLDALGTTQPWRAQAYLGGGQRKGKSDAHATESEATCLAIFRASVGKGI